ncbi:MAG: DegT/DnrJ/EryC1/StrS family aminotransferase [Patescibacteria group bacterium]
MIPLINIKSNKKTLKKIKVAVNYVIDSDSYILGEKLRSFEEKFAKYVGTKYAVGVGNGTDALRIALRALGIGDNDSVLTVAFTSPFTAVAISEEGATPVFCDINEKTLTIDVKDAQTKIKKNTRAIIPVHIYGNPADMDEIKVFAKKNKLFVIEDACQAIGAIYGKRKVGSLGHAGAFSFYPTKNLGAMGDGGMMVTNNKSVAGMARSLRHGGQTRRFWHKFSGVNSRLDEIQAAILEVKLKEIDYSNRKRAIASARYKKELSSLPIRFQESMPGSKSANHLFVITTKKRDGLKKYLESKGINSDVYYPYPVHMQPAFSKNRGDLPITERLCREVLALPLFPDMKKSDQYIVIQEIKNFFKDD